MSQSYKSVKSGLPSGRVTNERERLLGSSSSKGSSVSQAPKAVTKVKNDISASTPKNDSGSTLVIAFFLMLFFQLGNRIFGKLETVSLCEQHMFNY